MIKRGIQGLLIVFSIILLATPLLAQDDPEDTFDANKGFNWLVGKAQNGDYGDIMTTAFAAVALKDSAVLSHADLALAHIRSQEDKDKHCWPKGSCKVRETAFALWALNEFGEKTNEGEDWLRAALTPALKNNWWLQVVTQENGTCTIAYDGEEETIRVDAGIFPKCTATPTKTFFDLNRCLKKKNILVNTPSAEIDVNCKNLGPSTVISVVFNQGNTYTLVEQATTERSLITINNGCFGDSSKGSCSKETSLYTNWVLAELESPIDVDSWLKEKYDNLKPFDNALMFLASDDQRLFLDDLTKRQRNDGSFEKDVFTTAIAVIALKKGSAEGLADAIEFLEERQKEDGSWESNVMKTAIVLYSSFTSANIIVAPPRGGGPKGPVCGDNVCEDPETEATCPKDCKKDTKVCVVDGRCDANFGENSKNCAADCICGDNVCDSVERASGSCTKDCEEEPRSQEVCGNNKVEGFEDCDGSDDTACPGLCQSNCTCEEKKGGFGWLITLAIVVLVGLAGYFFFSKYHHKGGKQPKRPEFKPFTSQLQAQRKAAPKVPYTPPRTAQRKSKVDDELDKSIREAKKLIKKL